MDFFFFSVILNHSPTLSLSYHKSPPRPEKDYNHQQQPTNQKKNPKPKPPQQKAENLDNLIFSPSNQQEN